MCICMLLYNCCRPDQQELIYSKRNTCSPLFAFQDIETMVLKKIRILLRSCWEEKVLGHPQDVLMFSRKTVCLTALLRRLMPERWVVTMLVRGPLLGLTVSILPFS